MKYSDEQILDEIKRVAKQLGKNCISKKEFSSSSKISNSTIRYHFGNWTNALKKAGFTPIDSIKKLKESAKSRTINDDDLLRDLIRLYQETGKNPTDSTVNSKGKYSTRPYRKRWRNISNAFKFALKQFDNKEQYKDISMNSSISREIKNRKTKAGNIQTRKAKNNKIIYGEQINFRGLAHAPVNEQGVVYLFGMISKELGFQVESVRTAFPDCEAKRCFDKNKNLWERVKIEFEYESKNFLEHNHNIDECDIIICWHHNWSDCPIEVLELKKEINFLPSQ